MADDGALDRIETLRNRIETSDVISERDRDALIEFSDTMFLLKSEYGDYRHEKLLRHCTRMAEECGGLHDALADRSSAEKLVRWINRNYDNEETNQDYRVALRVFGRRVSDENGDKPPESLDWIPSTTSSDYDPRPNPAEMITWDDVQKLIDQATNSRDKAMVTVAWDSGVRSGEFRDLTVGDVTDHKHGLQIHVDGKTGQRSVTLIPSVPYLNAWLDNHPAPEDKEAPLWTKLQENESISHRSTLDVFKRLADRAGISKPVTLTNFRKSSASHLASEGMSQAHLEDHHGWVRGSDVAARYVSVFEDVSDRELARIHGLEIPEDDESEAIAPVVCPRCDRETPRGKDTCVWCMQALTPEAMDKARDVDGNITEEGLNSNDPEFRRAINEFREMMDRHPVLRNLLMD